MGRIYRPAPSRAARLNDYRWQDDPEAGEFSEYGRGRFSIVHIVLGIGLLALAGVVVAAIIGIVAALL